VESRIRSALTHLPDTLDETYERIFADIPQQWRPFVVHAICFLNHVSSAPMALLVSFLSVGDTDSDDETVDDLVNAKALRETLGSLITVSSPPPPAYNPMWEETDGDNPESSGASSSTDDEELIVKLAHYTIKEYVQSPRVAQSSAPDFYIPETRALSHCVRRMLLTLGRKDASGKPWHEFRAYCLKHADHLLKLADTAIASDSNLASSLFEALDPRRPNYECLSNIDEFRNWMGTYSETLDEESPSNAEMRILMNLIHHNLYATVTAFLLQYTAKQVAELCSIEVRGMKYGPENMPVISWLAEGHKDKYLILLLERCGHSFWENTADLLIWAMRKDLPHRRHKDEATVAALCRVGVPVDPKEARVTPLQLAASRKWVDCVKLLLERGADPNAVGDRTGWAPEYLGYFEGGHSPLALVRKKASSSCDLVYPQDLDSARQVEELLLEAGGREFCSWTVPQPSDAVFSAQHFY
jgi:hypothetical protein